MTMSTRQQATFPINLSYLEMERRDETRIGSPSNVSTKLRQQRHGSVRT